MRRIDTHDYFGNADCSTSPFFDPGAESRARTAEERMAAGDGEKSRTPPAAGVFTCTFRKRRGPPLINDYGEHLADMDEDQSRFLVSPNVTGLVIKGVSYRNVCTLFSKVAG